jgi:hypothetical protein
LRIAASSSSVVINFTILRMNTIFHEVRARFVRALVSVRGA